MFNIQLTHEEARSIILSSIYNYEMIDDIDMDTMTGHTRIDRKCVREKLIFAFEDALMKKDSSIVINNLSKMEVGIMASFLLETFGIPDEEIQDKIGLTDEEKNELIDKLHAIINYHPKPGKQRGV